MKYDLAAFSSDSQFIVEIELELFTEIYFLKGNWKKHFAKKCFPSI